MPNRQLTKDELQQCAELLSHIRSELNALSAGNKHVLFAYRRKVYKELMYDERGKPTQRRILKAQKRIEQDGKCAHCGKELGGGELDLHRIEAALGYTLENTRLVHRECHRKQQAERGFA
jgi:hypothetical protein